MPRTRQKIQTPTGQPYGAAQASQQAQKAVPLPQSPATPPADPMAAAMAMTPPSAPGVQPSAMPATHGLPIGPGAGPEVLPDPRTFTPIPSDQWLILQHLPTLEAVANQDGAPAMLRQLVRQLRGTLDPRVTQQALVNQITGADYGQH